MKRVFSVLMAVAAFSLIMTAQNLRDGYQSYTLDNGMKVYLWVDKDMPDVYGQVVIRAGSIDEPTDFTGLAHYLEHVAFKGTQKIGALDWEKEKPMYEQIISLYDELAKQKLPANKKDKTYAAIKAKRDELTKQINELTVASSKISQGSEFPTLVQSMGGYALNAYTSYDQTAYHNSFFANQMEKWLKLYCDRFQNPVFREFQAEIENVFEEYNMYSTDVSSLQQDKLMEVMFKGTNYARSIVGFPEHLKNPSITPVINFFNTWYVPNNMGLMLIGNFDPEAAKPMIEKTFGQMKSKTLPERKPNALTPVSKNEKIKVKLGNSPEMILGFNGVKEGDPEQLKIEFMLSLLNNDYGTGLLDKLMIDGKVGYAGAGLWSMRDCGKIIVAAAPAYDVSQFRYLDDIETEKVIMAEINKVKRGAVPSWLFQSVKDMYLQNIKQYVESLDIKTSILTSVFSYNEDIEDYFNMAEKIKAITPEDIKDIANKYFSFYTTLSFLESDPPKFDKIPKAEIKPLDNPDAVYSPYYNEFSKISVKEPAELPYIDFSDVKQQKLFDGGELFYVKNPKNDIFSLVLEYQVGTHTDKKLQYAAALMNYTGTMPNQTNYEMRRELSRYGASYGVGINDNKFTIQVMGNEKDLDKIMPIIFRLCLMPKLDNEQIEAVMGSEVSQRLFEKRIPSLVNAALMQYIMYGDQSPYIDRFTSKELIFFGSEGYNFLITNRDLTTAIQKVTSYPVKVHYSGQKPMEEVAKILKGQVPTQENMVPAQPDFYRDLVQNDKPVIYLLDNPDMKQASVSFYFPTGKYSKDEEVDYAAFNEYFGGGGLNDLFFLNIREKNSMAYTTYGVASSNPYNNTSWFRGYTGTQNDKVLQVIDVAMDLLKNMPVLPQRINDIKASVKAEYLSFDPSFRSKSQYLESFRKRGYTGDPAKENMPKIEALTFDNILNVYNSKIKDAPVIIVILGDKKNIDTKGIEAKYGKITPVPLSKIFKGGDYN